MSALSLGLFCLLVCARERQEEVPKPGAPAAAPNEWNAELLPDRSIYRPYLANPRQSHTGTKIQFPVRTGRESHIKIDNVLGSFRPLALWTDPNAPDTEMELFVEAAVFSRFDIEAQYDLDASDYRFGFPIVYRDGNVAMKLHVYHLTSHLGDEYISRVGRDRDSYHLEEAAAAASIQLEEFRVYAELGVGVYVGPATQSGRVEAGAEWIGQAWFSRVAPYTALDLETRNEIDWDVNASLMAGLMVLPKNGGNGFRGFLEYYRGHDQQTQFKSEVEHYYAIGVSTDF